MSDGAKTEILDRLRRAPRDRSPLHGTLIVLEGPEVGQFVVVDPGPACVLGRAEDAGLCLPHSSVSRNHAELSVVEYQGRLRARLVDLGSTNGLSVNRCSAREFWLASGDRIRLGRVLLRFEWMNDAELAYHRRQAEEHRLAQEDGLTGLRTRAFLEEQLPKLLEDADEDGSPLCCLLLDLDHFKAINDQHGHLAGDEILRRVSALLQSATRRRDAAVRYGGEELLCVLWNVAIDAAATRAEQLRRDIEQLRVPFEGVELNCTASIGVAERRSGEDCARWFRRADDALYAAKREGRNRVVRAGEDYDIATIPPAIQTRRDLDAGDD